MVYHAKRWAVAATVIVYLCCFALVVVRWLHIFNPNVYVISTEVKLHITNFTLCLEACLLIGCLQLLFGTGYASVAATGVLVVVIILLYEGFLRFMNTPDLMRMARQACWWH